MGLGRRTLTETGHRVLVGFSTPGQAYTTVGEGIASIPEGVTRFNLERQD
jgi:hypothetical protein